MSIVGEIKRNYYGRSQFIEELCDLLEKLPSNSSYPNAIPHLLIFGAEQYDILTIIDRCFEASNTKLLRIPSDRIFHDQIMKETYSQVLSHAGESGNAGICMMAQFIDEAYPKIYETLPEMLSQPQKFSEINWKPIVLFISHYSLPKSEIKDSDLNQFLPQILPTSFLKSVTKTIQVSRFLDDDLFELFFKEVRAFQTELLTAEDVSLHVTNNALMSLYSHLMGKYEKQMNENKYDQPRHQKLTHQFMGETLKKWILTRIHKNQIKKSSRLLVKFENENLTIEIRSLDGYSEELLTLA